MAYNTDILTSDDQPLSEVLAYGQMITDEYNRTDNIFQTMLGRTVDQRVFRQRITDVDWEKVAEGERPHAGSTVKSNSMAFTIDEFSHALGWTRNDIEDNPESILREHLEEMIMAADDLLFEETFGVMDGGIADGTELEWKECPAKGDREFPQDHNHVFDGTDSTGGATNPLFDDGVAHTANEHIGKANVQIQHHGFRPDIAFVSPQMAYRLVSERTDSYNWQIREARDLLTTPVQDIQFNIGGTKVVQTPELQGDDFYLFDTRQRPIYYNWVRPVELTDENGAPIVDPSDLMMAVGSARFGIKMVKPWAGVKVQPDNFA